MIINGDLTAGKALPSIRGLAKSLHISVLTVQKSYDVLQKDGFIETTAGKGCFVSAQNQDFYLEEQQKKIENHFTDAIEIAKVSGIKLDKLQSLLALLYDCLLYTSWQFIRSNSFSIICYNNFNSLLIFQNSQHHFVSLTMNNYIL